jgi:aspartate aminotransferase-like enzyme
MRLGHLGYVQPQHILQGIALLGQALVDHGAKVAPAEAVQAAREAMQP